MSIDEPARGRDQPIERRCWMLLCTTWRSGRATRVGADPRASGTGSSMSARSYSPARPLSRAFTLAHRHADAPHERAAGFGHHLSRARVRLLQRRMLRAVRSPLCDRGPYTSTSNRCVPRCAELGCSAVWAVPIGWEVLLRLPSGRVADEVLPGGRRSIADAADSVLPESRVNTQSNSQDTAGCREPGRSYYRIEVDF